MELLKYKIIDSILGPLKLIAAENSLVAILWEVEKPGRVILGAMKEDVDHPILKEAEQQLQRYFLKKSCSFTIPLKMHGTPFQKKVWQALLKIPHGTTRSYKEVAEEIGKPLAVRAVGTAIGKNPLSIILPCHRVIASNGSLAGFAGGLERKKTLLDLEKSFKT